MSRDDPSNVSDDVLRAREKWRYRGNEKPEFAEAPGAGQESVWDYPRPPAIETDHRRVRVRLNDVVIADTTAAVRVMETASPPVFYLPPADVSTAHLEAGRGESFCEWKGAARYWSVRIDDFFLENVGWSYPDPLDGFETIADFVSFYPARLTCLVDDERAHAQPGGFYGGWVTSELVGPFKGAPGTEWW